MRDIKELLERLNINSDNLTLYELALTHPSYNADANTKHFDYERLEYMGDAVLDYVAADLIFNSYPDMEPGNMSKLRSFLVQSHSLSNYARKIELANYIRCGHSISEKQIQQSDKILEDSFEALIGAIYLDRGINFVFDFIKNSIYEDIINFGKIDLTDYKSKLQEEMQAEHRESVHYVTISETGPAHDRTYVVNVLFNDIVLASGTGKSKKAAEQNAAKNALKKRSI
ncbi:MAG: ribonuclease III [Bacilli bacterium]|nr:ribonuclease III [Bacilli bacterium]